MPLTIDSSGGVAFDYSIAHTNRANDATSKMQEIPQKEITQEVIEKRVTQRLDKEEFTAIFFNRQDSQLNRDIINTFASKQRDDENAEFAFDNIDTFKKLLEKSDAQSV